MTTFVIFHNGSATLYVLHVATPLYDKSLLEFYTDTFLYNGPGVPIHRESIRAKTLRFQFVLRFYGHFW